MQDLDEVYYDKYHVNRQILTMNTPNKSGGFITNTQPKESKSKSHFYFSMTKSAIRIMGFCFLIDQQFITAGIQLILAEILGVIEEF